MAKHVSSTQSLGGGLLTFDKPLRFNVELSRADSASSYFPDDKASESYHRNSEVSAHLRPDHGETFSAASNQYVTRDVPAHDISIGEVDHNDDKSGRSTPESQRKLYYSRNAFSARSSRQYRESGEIHQDRNIDGDDNARDRLMINNSRGSKFVLFNSSAKSHRDVIAAASSRHRANEFRD